jgi:AcrR family transcriptional regulator
LARSRHFPIREDLILAVYRHDVQKLVDSVEQVLADHPPLEAFIVWFETLAAYIRVKHGLGDALHNAAIQNAIDETYAPVVAAVKKLLDACIADGSVRPDLNPADVLLLMGYLWRVGPGEDGNAQGRRLTRIVLDGILTGRPAEQPARGLDQARRIGILARRGEPGWIQWAWGCFPGRASPRSDSCWRQVPGGWPWWRVKAAANA